MRITGDIIKKTAELAALTFTDEEAERLKTELDAFVKMTDILTAADGAAGTEVASAAAPARGDEAKSSLSRADILSGAPEQADGYFVVPASF